MKLTIKQRIAIRRFRIEKEKKRQAQFAGTTVPKRSTNQADQVTNTSRPNGWSRVEPDSTLPNASQDYQQRASDGNRFTSLV